jgi:hypothetical protein
MAKRASERASPPAKRACRGVTRAGQPCRSTSIGADGYCTSHSPATNMAELGRLGGKARGRKRDESASDALEALATKSLTELLSSGSATARVQAAKFALDRLTANSPAGLEAAKRALWLDLQAERQRELPGARDRLARLVEREARARARAITEEQIAELVERKAEERAEQMYAERMLAETEAVKAEPRVDAAAPATSPATLEEMVDEAARRDARERGKT